MLTIKQKQERQAAMREHNLIWARQPMGEVTDGRVAEMSGATDGHRLLAEARATDGEGEATDEQGD